MSKARDIADLDFNSPDIDGGNIDGAVIGATTRANGDFLAISTSSTLTVANTNGYGTIEVGGSSGAFIDLKRPSSDDYDMRIVTDGGTGGRIDANGNIQINATNEAVFNENSADVDFRVESDSNPNMLFVDAGNDHVNIGTSADLGQIFNVQGGIGLGTNPSLTWASNYIRFQTRGASVPVVELLQSGSGGYAPRLDLMDGSGNVQHRIDAGGATVFNDTGTGSDFRVESDSNTHALFVDGANNRVGILGVPTVAFHVHGTSNDSPSESTAYVQFEGSGGNGLAFGTGAAGLNYSSWIQAGYVQNFGAAKYNLALQPLGANVLVGESNNNNGTYGKLNVLAPASTNWGNIAESALNIRQPNNTSYHGQIVFSNSAGGAYGYAAIGCDMTNGSGIGLGDLVFATKSQGTDAVALERLRVLSSGGLTFNGDTAQANAMDDYEEGTWDPTLERLGNAGVGIADAFSFRSGHYIKIGNIVIARWGFRTGTVSGGTGAAAVISGLPYTAKNMGSFQQAATFANNQGLTNDPDGPVLWYVMDADTRLQARLMTNSDTVMPSNYFQNNSWCIGTVIYDVA